MCIPVYRHRLSLSLSLFIGPIDTSTPSSSAAVNRLVSPQAIHSPPLNSRDNSSRIERGNSTSNRGVPVLVDRYTHSSDSERDSDRPIPGPTPSRRRGTDGRPHYNATTSPPSTASPPSTTSPSSDAKELLALKSFHANEYPPQSNGPSKEEIEERIRKAKEDAEERQRAYDMLHRHKQDLLHQYDSRTSKLL